MSLRLRVPGLLTLCCFVTSCASSAWRPAVLPGSETGPVGVGASPAAISNPSR